MSIEKIKERIKMIEDNDFTTNEIISEDINLNRDEIGKFLDPKNNLVVKAASKGFANTNKVASAHAELFSGGLKFSSDNKVKALPQNIQNLLKPIFNEMEKTISSLQTEESFNKEVVTIFDSYLSKRAESMEEQINKFKETETNGEV